jgi:integrase
MTAAPVRSINAVTLCEGENYVRFGSGRNQTVRIHFPGDVVKNEQAVDLLVPQEADKIVQDYMKNFQPLLGPSRPGQFCPSRSGGPKAATLLSKQLAAHNWRHVVGYIFLLHNPGCYEPIRRLLGHKSVETTRRYYAFLLDEDAQEMIDATFDGIRDHGRSRLKRTSRRKEVRHA